MIRRTLSLTAGGALLTALLLNAGPASAEGKKIVLAIPGVPPIYSATIAYVAEKQGFFKKHGADVEIRPFDNGTAAARAVVAGDIDMAWSPTPPVIVQISNADVPLVGVYGMPNPDWVIGTTESGKTCKDMADQNVGVDSINGARSIALRSMLAAGCKEVKIDQVKQIALGSSPGPALLAGPGLEPSAICLTWSILTSLQPAASIERSAIERAPLIESTPTFWSAISLQVLPASVVPITQSGFGMP